MWVNGLPGNDVLSVHPRMLSLLRTTVKEEGTVLLSITPFYYIYQNEFKVFQGDTLNVTPYLPGTSNYSKLILVGLNPATNLIQVVQGAESFESAITPPALPTNIPDGLIPSALVKLRYNITELTEYDITDARIYITEAIASGGGGEDTIGFPPPGDIWVIGTDNSITEHATIELATAAATSGEIIKLGMGYYTLSSGVTLAAGVKLTGAGNDQTIITTSGVASPITVGASCEISHFKLVSTLDSSNLNMIKFSSTSYAYARRVRVEGTTTTSGQALGYLFDGSGKYAHLIDCEASMTSATGIGYGFYLAAGNTCMVDGGVTNAAFIWSTGDISGLRTTSASSFATSGTKGWYINPNNVMIFLQGTTYNIQLGGNFINDMTTYGADGYLSAASTDTELVSAKRIYESIISLGGSGDDTLLWLGW